jgi:hypothetical protein
MLKEILSISGKPGLFKLISKGKSIFIAESLIDRKRIPVYPRDKVVALGDIAIFTSGEEVPLPQILQSIQKKENGEQINFNPAIQPEELKTWFAGILPDFDRTRVYPSDIKKIMNWYNLLVQKGLTDFEIKEEAETAENTETAEEVKS